MTVMTSGWRTFPRNDGGYIQVGGADPKNLLTRNHDPPATADAKMLVPETSTADSGRVECRR